MASAWSSRAALRAPFGRANTLKEHEGGQTLRIQVKLTVVRADEILAAEDTEAVSSLCGHRIHVPERVREIRPPHTAVVARRTSTIVRPCRQNRAHL